MFTILDDCFTMKKCGKIDMRILAPSSVPECLEDVVTDARMITKMIRQGVLNEITILLCDQNQGKLLTRDYLKLGSIFNPNNFGRNSYTSPVLANSITSNGLKKQVE